MSRRLTAVEFRDLRQSWQRRLERIPARFGSHLNYCAAVEAGLLEREPHSATVTNDPLELLTEIREARSEIMPEYRPPRKAKCNANIEWADQPDDDD